MELRQLRYFVAVAEELNFTRAAARIPVAVGALSTQIRRLERELGVQLFERTTHAVSLTPAGARFLATATDVLERLDREIDGLRTSAPALTITVGVVDEGLAELTVPVLDAFRERFPHVAVRVQPCSDAYVLATPAVFDALFWVHPVAPFPDWRFDAVLESDPVAVVARDHPLAERPALVAADVLHEVFVRVPEEVRPWFARHHLEDMRGAPARLTALEVRDVPAGQSLVSLDRSVMVQPGAKLRYFLRPGVVGVPLTDVAAFPLGVARRATDDRAEVRALLDVARELAHRSTLPEGTRPAGAGG